MRPIKTHWPEIKKHLTCEVRADPYAGYHLRQDFGGEALFYVRARHRGADVMRMHERSYGVEVWLEAQTDDARALLRSLPSSPDLFLSLGSPLGLDLAQEEITGRVTGNSLFCMVDRQTLRTAQTCPVSEVTENDREALHRYPPARNRDAFFRFLDEGKVNLWGCYEEGEIVGYAAAFRHDSMVAWVDVRPELRRRGYGRSLLSAITTDLLRKHKVVFYDACMDEMANSRLCLSVGFVPLRLMCYFTGKRKVSKRS